MMSERPGVVGFTEGCSSVTLPRTCTVMMITTPHVLHQP